MAVKISGMIKREMQLEDCEAVYWTDSTAVLHMISNTSNGFPTFVANRFAKIEEGSKPDLWRCVGVTPGGLCVNTFDCG